MIYPWFLAFNVMKILFSRMLHVAAVVLLWFPAWCMAGEQTFNKLDIGRFSDGLLRGWKNKEFKGQTIYKIVELDGASVLEADSNKAASGLYFEKKIDLEKTPYLNWRWRVDEALSNSNELSKTGDDFAARVYVVVSGGLIFWNTRAINYVWASGQVKSSAWPNPFAGDHAMMVAVRSGNDKTKTWYKEKRNILEDFKNLTGKDIRNVDAVAIMSDTDNAGGHAIAYYGDIYITSE